MDKLGVRSDNPFRPDRTDGIDAFILPLTPCAVAIVEFTTLALSVETSTVTS